MTRKQANAAFENLRRHASAIPTPTAPADALDLLDRAVLTRLQRDAIVHYISVGPDNLALAYSVLKAGVAALVTARFVSLDAAVEPQPSDPPGSADPSRSADRLADADVFAERLIVLSDGLAGADPHELAIRLLEAFTDPLSSARDRLAAPPPGDRDDENRRVGDLLEAAGIAYLVAQLLESPPRPVAAAAGR
jgi:hypothetical protein